MNTATMTAPTLEEDLAELEALNLQYLTNDQTSNVAAYEKILDARFTASLADLKLYTREEFLAMVAQPRPFTDLAHQDLRIDHFGDVALCHARITFRTLDGVERKGRYTDEWQRQDGRWMCIGANVIAENVAV